MHGNSAQAKDETEHALNPMFDQLRSHAAHIITKFAADDFMNFLNDPASVKAVTDQWINDVFDALQEFILSKRSGINKPQIAPPKDNIASPRNPRGGDDSINQGDRNDPPSLRRRGDDHSPRDSHDGHDGRGH